MAAAFDVDRRNLFGQTARLPGSLRSCRGARQARVHDSWYAQAEHGEADRRPRDRLQTPAGLMGLQGGAIRSGVAADLVLFRTRTMNELLSRSRTGRMVIRHGQAIDRSLPGYRELDGLIAFPIDTSNN
jgi:hypothetical protein